MRPGCRMCSRLLRRISEEGGQGLLKITFYESHDRVVRLHCDGVDGVVDGFVWGVFCSFGYGDRLYCIILIFPYIPGFLGFACRLLCMVKPGLVSLRGSGHWQLCIRDRIRPFHGSCLHSIRRRHNTQLPTISHDDIPRHPRARLGCKPEDAARHVLGVAGSAQRRHTSGLLLRRELLRGLDNVCGHLGRIHYGH